MSRSPLAVRALIVAFLCPLPLAGQAQQTPAPVDANAVLSLLKDLRSKQQQTMRNTKSQVLANIIAAAADNTSAGRTYEQAVTAVEFQGQGSDAARTAEWHKRQGELLRNRDFLTALRLQLVYLSITWQRSAGAKVSELLPSLYDYTAQVDANRDVFEPFANMLKRPVNDTVFATYYQVGPYISGLQDWEMQSFNTEGIFQKTILPELRRAKDPRVLDYWDKRIQLEDPKFDRAQNSLAANRFNRIRKPALLWNRAEDELLLGDRTHAINDMLILAKTFSDHPDFEKWAARLEEIVSDKGPVGSPAPPPAS